MASGSKLLAFLVAALVGAVLVYGASATLDAYLLSIIAFVGINVILAVSLNITNGFTGLFSLGHPAFMTIGGYVTAIMSLEPKRKPFLLPDLPAWLATSHLPFLLALITGGLAATLVALVVGFPVLRLRGHYLAVATLGLIFIVQGLAVNLDGYTRGALGLNGLPELTNLWWVYGWMLLTLYVCWKLKHSSLGRTMLAIRENELAAACLGVRITRTRIFSFALGAFFAGVAGGLWAHLVTLITPSSFSFLFAFQLVVMVVLGGSGSITGAALVGALLTIATEALHPVEEAMGFFGASQLLMALAVLLVLVFRPKGLFGMAEPDLLAWIGKLPGRQPTRSGSKRQREV
ncbi:MAG TPA: branched-chain amino acid ABC transporter permease [Dongiaceae bacterium]|jgi:branched-chain amino acid transport system permease protein|nr:branched-chain amino acid ABC transporter permease [Dongiaceae bacterium]